MTRRMIPLGAGFFAGLFAAFYLSVDGVLGKSGFWILSAAAFLLGMFALIFQMKFSARAMLFFGAFAVAVAYSALYTCFCLEPLEALDGEEIAVSGRVVSYTDGDRSAVVIKGTAGGIPSKMLVYINDFGGDYGDTVTVTARISKIEDTPFFSFREYYLPDGILLFGTAVGEAEIRPSRRTVLDMLRSYSRKVSLSVKRNVGGEAGEFLSALLTGDRTSFSDGLQLKLNRSGTAHLAAVSGLHVTVVALFAVSFIKRLKAPRALGAAVTGFFVAAFIVFSGIRVTAVRAGIMTAVSVASALVRRRTDAFNTICICAVAMTIFNPYAAADVSLCLSLAGVFGVSVAAPNLIREFKIRGKFLRRVLASLSASALTAPMVMLWFNELSLVSPITNIAAVPLCSAALVLGMIYAATGCVFTPAIKLSGLLCDTVVRLSGAVSSLEFTYIPLGSKLVGVAAICSVIISAAIYLITKNTRLCTLAAVFLAAIVMCVYGVQTASVSQNLYLTVMTRSDHHVLVLRKAAQCIIIDLDGRMSTESENLIERAGISDIRAVVLLDNAEAGYSAYLPLKPESVLCFGGAYIKDGIVEKYDIYGGSSIEIFGVKAVFEQNSVRISYSDGEVLVCKGRAAEGDGLCISFLDGLTVINSGENAEVYVGGLIKDIRM